MKSSGALGKLIQVGTMVAESTSKLIDSEIIARELVLKISNNGATIVAQMVAGEVGAVVEENNRHINKSTSRSRCRKHYWTCY